MPPSCFYRVAVRRQGKHENTEQGRPRAPEPSSVRPDREWHAHKGNPSVVKIFFFFHYILLIMLLVVPMFPLCPPTPSTPPPSGNPPTMDHVHGSCVQVLWLLHFLYCTLHPHGSSVTAYLYFLIPSPRHLFPRSLIGTH